MERVAAEQSWHGFARSTIDVDGVDIALWRAGPEDALPVVLVHGNGASRAWWVDLAPALARRWRVTIVELSGHGDSERRDSYSWDVWSAEIAATVRDAGGRAVLVGHSMGGGVVSHAAGAHPSLVEGIVVFDWFAQPYRVPELPPREPPRQRFVPSREELEQRFRLRPPQPHPSERLMRELRAVAVHETPRGWTWRHDPRASPDYDDPALVGLTSRIRCPSLWVFSQATSRLHATAAEQIIREAEGDATVVSVPATHHHLVLEEPGTCAQLVSLLAERVRDHAGIGIRAQ